MRSIAKLMKDWQFTGPDGVTAAAVSYTHLDSKEYFSWERYFTALLIEKAAGTYLNYTKKTLNKAYLSDSTKNAILGQMMKGKPE